MYLNWIESRDKSSSYMLKRSEFTLHNCISYDNTDDAKYIIRTLFELQSLALGKSAHLFTNQICRSLSKTDAGSLLWYCKTREGQERVWPDQNSFITSTETLIDEEELYTEDNRLLFSRNLKGVQLFETNEFIPINPDLSAIRALKLDETQTLYHNFQKIYYLNTRQFSNSLSNTIQNLIVSPACIIIDATEENDPINLTNLLSSLPNHVQIIAFNAFSENLPLRKIIEKRNGISIN